MCYVNPTIALRKMHSQYQSLLVSSLSITWYDIVNWFVQVQKILADFSIANLTTTTEDVDMGEIMLNIILYCYPRSVKEKRIVSSK